MQSKAPALPRLRTVLLYSRGHLGSAIVFNLLHKRELEIVGLVRASALRSAKTGKMNVKSMQKTGLRLGLMLAWQRTVKILTYGVSVVVSFFRPHGFLPGWLLAHRLKIPVFTARDVNAPETLAFIESHKPDVVVSAYFHQIIRAPLLKIPRLGVLNIHPGWLPNYRGVMNYFWVIKNDEQYGGVSVHWIDEGIDTGPLLARARFLIPPQMTQHQVLMKTAILGSRLLQHVARKLIRGEALPAIPVTEEDAHYYTMPDARAFDEYFKKRRFFRIRNILRVLFHGVWRG
jgi:methionyl-tRNA formyltransferase